MTNTRGREVPFPLLAGVFVATLVAAVRIVSGVGFGEGRSAEPFSPLGIFWNEEDNLQYIAWCQQAAEGRWLLENRFTLEPHDAVVFHPLFLLIGRLAAATGVPTLCVIVALGLASIPVITVSAYCCARFLGLGISTARTAVVILSAGYGLSRLGAFLYRTVTGASIPPWLMGADLFYYDALFFPTFFEYPFITICYAVLTVQCAVLARADAHAVNASPSFRWVVVLATLQLLLGLSHPYEHILMTAAYAGAALVSALVMSGGGDVARRRIPVLMALALPSGLVVGYYLWLSQLPVWQDVARQSVALMLPCPRTVWLWGYGVLLPLAIFGGWTVVRDILGSGRPEPSDPGHTSNAGRCLWLMTWALLFLIPLIIFEYPRSKLCAGGYLPLAILGAIALERTRSHATSGGRPCRSLWVQRVMACAMWLMLLHGSIWQIGVFAHQCHRVRSEIFDVARRLSAEGAAAGEPRPKVLTEPRIARLLVALAGVRVYCGNVYKTPDFPTKQARLVEAGVLPPPDGLIDLTAMTQSLIALLEECDFDYVVTFGDNPIDTALAELQLFSAPESYGKFKLYAARNPRDLPSPVD